MSAEILHQHFQGLDLNAPVDAQRLAQEIFGRENRFRVRAQRLADDILGRKARERRGAIVKKRRQEIQQHRRKDRERQQVRRDARPNGHPKRRCFDWMLHSGDVHYARNGSSFDKYTKIDANVSNLLGFADQQRAIGIGTVKLLARRAADCAAVCTITLHNVLHIPGAPCNGISQARLVEAQTAISYRPDGLYITADERSQHPGVPLFYGTKEHFLQKIALCGAPEGESPLWDEGNTPITISITANDPQRLSDLGQSMRTIHDVSRDLGFRLNGPDCEVEC